MAEVVQGAAELQQRLANVEKKLRTKILKDAVGQGGKVALVGAKSKVRQDTGLLKKALARKVKAYRSGAAVVAIVGPRSAYRIKKDKKTGAKTKVETGFGKKVSRGGRKEVYATPSKYSHLVEKGTKRSKAYPFLGVAGRAPEVQATVTAVMAAGIESAAKGA